jgi:hypothetical protein
VAGAAEAALAAIGGYDDAVRAELALATDEAIETAKIEEMLRKAASEGVTAPPKVRRTDWAWERQVRIQRRVQARTEALDALGAYKAEVKAALPEWRAALVDRIAPTREQAAEDLRRLRRSVAEHAVVLATIRAMDSAVDGHVRPGGRATLMGSHLDKVAETLESGDPEVNGDALADGPEPTPKQRVMQAAERRAEEAEAALRASGRSRLPLGGSPM